MQLRTKNLADYAQERALSSPNDVVVYLEGGRAYSFWQYF